MRGAFVAFAALLSLLSSFGAASAQSGDHVLVLTYVCETYHNAIGGGFGVMPEDCHYEGGISIIVTDQSGTVVAECTSSESVNPGWCSIQVPLGTPITITEDVSTVPAGYAPTRNPIVTNTPPPPGATGEWIKEFINVATVNLPTTGAGAGRSSDHARGLPFAATLFLLLSIVAYERWRAAHSDSL
jgi:hypothetical protein